MRIITGLYKGRRLKSPKDNKVRPTSDKVKEAVFSMLIPYMEGEFKVLDLFAGSGNMGLEALSRGASLCYFSDSSRDSLKLARENAAICGCEDQCVFFLGDYKANLSRIRGKVNIIFIDPPYADKYILPALKIIREKGLLAEDGCIVCEHSSKDILPEEYEGFVLSKDRRYGAIGVSLYE